MFEEEIRLAVQQTQVDSNNSGFSFVSEISGIFSHMSSHDRASRKREKIRKDLVQVYFETELAVTDSARSAIATQLDEILRLD